MKCNFSLQRIRKLTTPKLRRSHQHYGIPEPNYTTHFQKVFGSKILCKRIARSGNFKDEFVKNTEFSDYSKGGEYSDIVKTVSKPDCTFVSNETSQCDPPSYEKATESTEF